VFKSQGIGIGLSTAKELATTLGGGIELTSSPGEGTKVTFSVQVRDGEQDLGMQVLKNSTI